VDPPHRVRTPGGARGFVCGAVSARQSFQDPCTPVMEAIVEVHAYIMFFVICIVTFVFTALTCVVFNF